MPIEVAFVKSLNSGYRGSRVDGMGMVGSCVAMLVGSQRWGYGLMLRGFRGHGCASAKGASRDARRDGVYPYLRLLLAAAGCVCLSAL